MGFAVAGMIPGGKTFGGVLKKTLDIRQAKGLVNTLGNAWENTKGMGLWDELPWGPSGSFGSAIGDLAKAIDERRMAFAFNPNSWWDTAGLGLHWEAKLTTYCGLAGVCASRDEMWGLTPSDVAEESSGSSSSSSSSSTSGSTSGSSGSSSSGDFYTSGDGKWYVKGGNGIAFT